MWISFAFLSAFFAGITAVLAKCGIRKTDSTLLTALRTVVVLIFSWIMVFVVGSFDQIRAVDGKTFLFLILSGLSTGASWLCYFKALQNGNINKVVPIDKLSTVFTIILAFIFLGEPVSLYKAGGVVAIAVGTMLMIEKKKNDTEEKKGWLLYAFLSAVFASLTAILGKIGINGIDSTLGTAIRTIVVLIASWVMVGIKGESIRIKELDKKELLFIVLSGVSTGASWLCYYKALKEGSASVVVAIDKLSILVTVLFSYIVFKEKLTKKSLSGLVLIVCGTLVMLL